jgi:predicted Holliday junction resolvase-like endonuclease
VLILIVLILILTIIIIIIIIQVVRTHQHNTDSSMLQTAGCLRTEVQREARNLKDSIAEKTKERWHGTRMHGQLPRNLRRKDGGY